MAHKCSRLFSRENIPLFVELWTIACALLTVRPTVEMAVSNGNRAPRLVDTVDEDAAAGDREVIVSLELS